MNELYEQLPTIITTVAINAETLHVFLTQHSHRISQAVHGWALPCLPIAGEEATGLQCITSAGIAQEAIQSIERLGIFFHHKAPEKTRLAFLAFVKTETAVEGTAWWKLADLPAMSSGHRDVVAYATKHLWLKLAKSHHLLTLLPGSFTLQKAQDLLYSLEQAMRRDNGDYAGPVWA